VVYTDGTVPDSGSAEIGICASQPALRLDTAQPSFYWVVSGNPVSPDPLFAGMDFNWVDANHLQVHLYNEQSISVTVLSLAVLLPSGPLSLDDLNDGVVSTLPMASEQVTDPLVLAGGASSSFDVFFAAGGVRVPLGMPIVLEAVVSTQDDLGDPIHVIAQTDQPFSELFLPALNK
jgi:hypothetical protein